MKAILKSERMKSYEMVKKHHLLCSNYLQSLAQLLRHSFQDQVSIVVDFATCCSDKNVILKMLLRNLLCNPVEKSSAELMSCYSTQLFQRSHSYYALLEEFFKRVLERKLYLQKGCFSCCCVDWCCSAPLLASSFSFWMGVDALLFLKSPHGVTQDHMHIEMLLLFYNISNLSYNFW